jgi:hypothetical protein
MKHDYEDKGTWDAGKGLELSYLLLRDYATIITRQKW